MSINRPTARSDRPAVRQGAPRLWSEGSQQPRFALGAFVRVSFLLSRRTARQMLLGTARLLLDGAERMAENTLGPQFARAWRLGRALPARDDVARGLTAMAGFMTVCADVAEAPPPVAMPEPMPAPVPAPVPLLISPRPRRIALPPTDAKSEQPKPHPTPAVLRAADPDFDAPTLAAIRAMIDEMREPPAVAPRRPAPVAVQPASGRALLTHGVPLSPPEPQVPTLTQTLAARSFGLAAGLMAGGVTLLVLPVGLIRATLAHLNGDDLRTWS